MNRTACSIGLACSSLVFLLCSAAPCRAADAKDNLEYVYWAKFKPGSSTVVVTEMQGANAKYVTETTNKLVEVHPDKLVLETSSTITFNGQTRTNAAKPKDVPAKKEGVPELKDAGDAEVEVGGKKIKCKVKTFTQAMGPNGATIDMNGKIHVSEEVPGGMVKMEMKSDKGTISISLKSFEVK